MASDTITCKTILRSSVVKLTYLYIEGGEEEAWCVVEESPDEEAWCVVEESPYEEALFPSLLPSNLYTTNFLIENVFSYLFH